MVLERVFISQTLVLMLILIIIVTSTISIIVITIIITNTTTSADTLAARERLCGAALDADGCVGEWAVPLVRAASGLPF